MSDVLVSVTIDTEEDDWGAYGAQRVTVDNIALLSRLQALFERHGARPTYLVNLAPLVDDEASAVLRDLATAEGVEIGAHCHPWNTPPESGRDERSSMMCNLTEEVNLAKLRSVTDRAEQALGVRPRSFRAGRWGLGRTVSRALAQLDYRVDVSVSPLWDWSDSEGPDYSDAPLDPYRFHPDEPFRADPGGALWELPTTVGYLRGEPRGANRRRRALERSPLARLKVVGLLDRLGVLARRWLSPEVATGPEMIRLAESSIAHGRRYLNLTFHSCALLPGATPFVGSEREQTDFLERIGVFLEYAKSGGYRFVTVSEAVGALSSG